MDAAPRRTDVAPPAGRTARARRLRASALVLAAALAAPLAACAHSPPPAVSTHLATVEILDRTDNTLLPVYVSGDTRWIVGTPGHEYAIRIRNHTGMRILAVPSVDGVNAVTGETASPDQSGSFHGFFAGAGAERAGMVYTFDSGIGGINKVSGAAVFTQTSLGLGN